MDTELDAGMETRPDAGLEADRAAPPQPRGPDEEADFTRLYADEYPNIVRYLLRRGVGDAAPDLAAETFVVAWRRRGQWLPLAADSRTAWLYGVARLVWRNELRAGQRRSGLLRRAAADRDLGAGSTTGRSIPPT